MCVVCVVPLVAARASRGVPAGQQMPFEVALSVSRRSLTPERITRDVLTDNDGFANNVSKTPCRFSKIRVWRKFRAGAFSKARFPS